MTAKKLVVVIWPNHRFFCLIFFEAGTLLAPDPLSSYLTGDKCFRRLYQSDEPYGGTYLGSAKAGAWQNTYT